MERGNAAKIAAPAALPPAAPDHHRTAAVRASNGRHKNYLLLPHKAAFVWVQNMLTD